MTRPLAAGLLFSVLVIALGATAPSPIAAAPPGIAFIQANSATPQTRQATVSVAYLEAQAAGHLDVVIVGASDSSAQVQSVADTANNTYQKAVGPTVNTSGYVLSVYFAANTSAAAAGANTVTVRFAAPVSVFNCQLSRSQKHELAIRRNPNS